MARHERLIAKPLKRFQLSFKRIGPVEIHWRYPAFVPSTPFDPEAGREISTASAYLEHSVSAAPSVRYRDKAPDMDGSDRVRLDTEEFAADPHRAYEQMRKKYGPVAPVILAPGVPAALVIGYSEGLQILHDPEHFPADPRTWQQGVPADSPVWQMMVGRPNALRTTGIEHARYRETNVAAMYGVDLHRTRGVGERIALEHINRFCSRGRADLVSDFAQPVVFETMSTLLGCDSDISAQAAAGMAMVFDTVNADEGNAMIASALAELVDRKRARPGNDVTSRLIEHKNKLSDEEVVEQLVTIVAGTSEPQVNLIVNTLLLMMTSERFSGDVAGGALSTRDALDEVLFLDPPLANYSITYPRQPQLINRVWLPAHKPVVISLAACNNDPAIGGDRTSNRSHLAFGAGPHACPAQRPAYQIAEDAIDQFLDVLPEATIAIPTQHLKWRPGPFHRALSSLPVEFEPAPSALPSRP